MHKVNLKKTDYRSIMNIAQRLYLEQHPEFKEFFLCSCYVNAILKYAEAEGWIIKEGKVYKTSK